ncbi:hypothetical protein K466DRAFT_589157 [Polyporus arcularius HHB13444]|uniref:DUF6533 domain-containing protein n=1 Tax=Polyporus arcularius HHB13444 TaxID=1314778 RepID=A0A5C3P3A7_9APHY|nr:hypothetical protein K466DRAFT_589157 [Polyporus arcularius HHB13444]
MSSQAAALVAAVQSQYTSHLCIAGSSVFLMYDYVITFGQEVELFWTNRLTGATVLFFANRYISLLFDVMGLVEPFGRFSDQSCPRFVKALAGVSYSQYIIWASFSGLRAYALSRQKILSAFVFLLLLVPAGINYAQFSFGLSGVNSSLFGCISVTQLTSALARKLVIASRTCIITADAILVVITVVTLAKRGVMSTLTTHSRWTLSSVLLRDGLMYFFVLMTLNVLHMAFTLSTVFSDTLSLISLFSNQVEAVLVSHFLLDLQAANRRTLKLSRDDPLNFTTTWTDSGGNGSLNFARVIGSLGSSIAPSSSEGDTDTMYEDYVPSEEFELKTPVRESLDPEQQPWRCEAEALPVAVRHESEP